jgi:hypothetical protein
MKEMVEKILSAPQYLILDVATEPSLHNASGVYLIIPPDGSRVVYVGKTRSKSIAGRMKDHLSIDTNSDLKGMLKNVFTNYPQEKENYLVQYIAIPDDKERTLFEHFAIAVLNPPFNK